MLKPSGCEVKRTGCFENSGHLTALGVSDLPVNLFELLKHFQSRIMHLYLSLSVFFKSKFCDECFFPDKKTYHFSTARNADNLGGWQMPHLWWYILITHKDRYCEGLNMRTHACDDHTAHTHTHTVHDDCVHFLRVYPNSSDSDNQWKRRQRWHLLWSMLHVRPWSILRLLEHDRDLQPFHNIW